MARVIQVGPVVVERRADGWRAASVVGRVPLWYESRDLRLEASAEGIASALLPVTTARLRALCLVDSVSDTWCSNVARMMVRWQEWWGYPVLPPTAPRCPAPRVRHSGAVLGFTGGVDSFFTLLHSGRKPDLLAFVHGYDIPLDDVGRADGWERSLREIAVEVNASAVVLRSNLRRHPVSARSNWERSHGGALAAMGHLLTSSVGTLFVASSFPVHYGYRWGSHAELDPLWSSDRLEVVHHGEPFSRVAKVRALAGHDLVQRHLRVCWENRSAEANCSCCDKCVCTMVAILASGAPGRFRSFDWRGSLEDRLRSLPATRYLRTYGELLEADLPTAVIAEIRALLQRSAATRGPTPSRRPGWLRWFTFGQG